MRAYGSGRADRPKFGYMVAAQRWRVSHPVSTSGAAAMDRYTTIARALMRFSEGDIRVVFLTCERPLGCVTSTW
jgi:hypothetical protein